MCLHHHTYTFCPLARAKVSYNQGKPHNLWAPHFKTTRGPQPSHWSSHCPLPWTSILHGPGVLGQQQSWLNCPSHCLRLLISSPPLPQHTTFPLLHRWGNSHTKKDGKNSRGERLDIHSKETRSSKPFSSCDHFRHTSIPTHWSQGLTPVPRIPLSTSPKGNWRGALVLQNLLHCKCSRGNSQARTQSPAPWLPTWQGLAAWLFPHAAP